MADEARIIHIISIISLSIVLILALIYLSLIILVPRFHTINNILTGNYCLSGVVCCLFWIAFDVIATFYPTILITSSTACFLTQYLLEMVNCLVIHSLIIITINRFFTIIYPNKRFFKRHTWPFISSIVQWIVAIILPLPNLIFFYQVNIS